MSKKNSGKSTKKKLTKEIVEKMSSIELNPRTFQRSARPYFKTTASDSSVWLKNLATQNSLLIDFEHDKKHDYMRLRFALWYRTERRYNHIDVLIKKPRYNRDLFIKLLKYDLL